MMVDTLLVSIIAVQTTFPIWIVMFSLGVRLLWPFHRSLRKIIIVFAFEGRIIQWIVKFSVVFKYSLYFLLLRHILGHVWFGLSLFVELSFFIVYLFPTHFAFAKCLIIPIFLHFLDKPIWAYYCIFFSTVLANVCISILWIGVGIAIVVLVVIRVAYSIYNFASTLTIRIHVQFQFMCCRFPFPAPF